MPHIPTGHGELHRHGEGAEVACADADDGAPPPLVLARRVGVELASHPVHLAAVLDRRPGRRSVVHGTLARHRCAAGAAPRAVAGLPSDACFGLLPQDDVVIHGQFVLETSLQRNIQS